MHAVIETSGFLNDASAAGMSDDERADIVWTVAANPMLGVLIPGTGGARKIRVAGRGKGKSGGYRVVTYYAAPDGPARVLLTVIKNEPDAVQRALKRESV